MIQSTTISDEDYTHINSIPQTDCADVYERIWASTPKDDFTNQKLDVEFIISPDSHEPSYAELKTINNQLSETINQLESELKILRELNDSKDQRIANLNNVIEGLSPRVE